MIRRGDGFLGVMFQFVIIMSLIFCFVSLWRPFIHKQNIDYMAKTLVRAVEANGRIDASIRTLESDLKREMGLNPTIRWTATYISGTDKIQIRTRFSVTISDTSEIKIFEPSFGSPFVINIPLTKTFTGISQVFWK